MKNLNMAAMMKQAQMMQSRMQEVQEEVGQKTVEAIAGGGMVTVTANGKGEIVSIKIDQEGGRGRATSRCSRTSCSRPSTRRTDAPKR